MKKLIEFIKLSGLKGEDNKLIQNEKLKYLFFRLIEPLIFKKNVFTMGDSLKKQVIANNGYGLFYCREKSHDLHIISGSYEFYVRKLFEKLSKKSKVIVDIGAHIGKYSILASKINSHAKVYAIEPEKDNFRILEANVKLNNLRNVFPIKIALSDRKGEKDFSKSNIGISFNEEKKLNITIKTNTLDNLFMKREFRLDLVKIDIDGSELKFLNGAKKFLQKKRIKNMIIEIDDKNYLKIKSLLEDYNYVLKKVQYNNYWAFLK